MKSKKTKVKAGKKTHLSIILDRTGSMESIKTDIIGGFNTFLKEQKKSNNKITLTLVQFDSQDPYEIIHDMKSIKDIPALTDKTFVPRGCTPLLDAIGKGVTELDKTLGAMNKKTKPENVVIVIITDGQENASKEFKKEQIEKIVKDKTATGWQFVFLSADLGSINDSSGYGFTQNATMAYDATGKGTSNMFRSLSMNVTSYAKGLTKICAFTNDDRDKQDNEKKIITKK